MCCVFSFAAENLPPVKPDNPCVPTPCGPYSQCKVSGDSPSCSCLPEYIGVPPFCKPECIGNSECPSHLACIGQKCKDPCPGTCGANADCRVVSHTPQCLCSIGYTGDPFVQCNQVQQSECYSLSHWYTTLRRRLSSRSYILYC